MNKMKVFKSSAKHINDCYLNLVKHIIILSKNDLGFYICDFEWNKEPNKLFFTTEKGEFVIDYTMTELKNSRKFKYSVNSVNS